APPSDGGADGGGGNNCADGGGGPSSFGGGGASSSGGGGASLSSGGQADAAAAAAVGGAGAGDLERRAVEAVNKVVALKWKMVCGGRCRAERHFGVGGWLDRLQQAASELLKQSPWDGGSSVPLE
ncbi:unnamed protein product, partial [Phaeothamnion confervicola]